MKEDLVFLKKNKTVVFTPLAITYIKKAFEEHKSFVLDKGKQFFPNGGYNGKELISFINKCLKPFSKKHNLVLKPHSDTFLEFIPLLLCCITPLFKTHSFVMVQNKQRGGADIRSTLAYSRSLLSNSKQEEILTNNKDSKH